jgi:hypothetical protein
MAEVASKITIRLKLSGQLALMDSSKTDRNPALE